MAAKKKVEASEWNSWETRPANESAVIVKMSTGEYLGEYYEHEGVSGIVQFEDSAMEIEEYGDTQWKMKPTDPAQTETKPNKNDLLDIKKISNEMAQRWFTEKILEEFGTVAVDLQLNSESIIVYYNAGAVKKS